VLISIVDSYHWNSSNLILSGTVFWPPLFKRFSPVLSVEYVFKPSDAYYQVV